MSETPNPLNISVGSCQMVPILGNVDASLAEVKRALSWAQQESVDVICLPECYLTGYCRTPEEARAHSIELGSALFSRLISELRRFDPVVILGLIERCGPKLFNSAVVVERGRVLGVYRKQHLIEKAFSRGRESPVFERNGVKYGVNICYDANFPEAATALAEGGAKAIFYPLNNNLPHATARKWRSRHVEILSARARERSVWVISADVVARSPATTGYGCTAIINPDGRVIERCPELTTGYIRTAPRPDLLAQPAPPSGVSQGRLRPTPEGG
jgi:predicted amidohydrolase